MMASTQRLKTEFQQFANLHLDFAQSQWRAYGNQMRLGSSFLYLALFLTAFGIVRLFDGIALHIIEGGSVATDAYFLSGGLLLLGGILLLGIANIFLKKTKEVTKRVFREIGEDVKWMKKLL